MTHLITKASLAILMALATVSAASAASPERAVITDVQYRPVRACSPVLAVQKARAHGLRRARIVDITPRRVVVAGRDRFGVDRMVFANVRGCPLIRR